jgi:hypothetical protein
MIAGQPHRTVLPMHNAGPALETLLRRLADTPPDFLDEPRIGASGQVHVAAVVNDLLAGGPGRASLHELQRFDASSSSADAARLRMALVMTWLLADEAFQPAGLARAELLQVLDQTAAELAALAPPTTYMKDPDRREELVRVVLARLGLRPRGETIEQATDRLSALSALERQRLLQASRASLERARAIRAALVRKAAEESADKWTRE